MSLRMPQNLSTSPRFDTGLSVLEAELMGERAAVLGRLGREVETTLAALAAASPGDASRRRLRASASDAVWRFFIQREVCGCWNTLKLSPTTPFRPRSSPAWAP